MKNSLAEKHPELVAEWSERNLPLTPMQIGIGILRTVICQICNFFFRADICLLHTFSCNCRLIQRLNTMYLFSGLNL